METGPEGFAPRGSPRGAMRGLANYQQALAPEVQTKGETTPDQHTV
jgi:hypothetical protein